MARNHWVAIIEMNALRRPELEELVRYSYQLVREKLPKKTIAELEAKSPAKATKAKRTPVAKRKR
jgi:predicted DNA-binding protein (MmcQ/YjbR family)